MALKIFLVIACAFEGLSLGFLGGISLSFAGIHPEKFVPITLDLLGAVCGGVVGAYLGGPEGRGKTIAGWSHWTAWALGGVGLVAGFIGPIILRSNSPQGPLFGIFVTGPLGAVVGAGVGIFIGFWKSRVRPAMA